jgi:pimeloyl-ACP methyl ester carboxylesterase
MSRETIVLLPGMDGTGRLFEPFIQACPEQFTPDVVTLPGSGSYEELSEAIAPRIGQAERVVVVAESFSGPLAVRITAQLPDSVRALVLCNSFVAPPRSALLRALPWSVLFSFSPPAFVIRHFFVGPGASTELVESVRLAVREASPQVLSARLVSILSENCTSLLGRIDQRVLYLRGAGDRLVRRNSAELVVRTAKQAEEVTIPGPHLLLQRYPRESWAAITRFLAGPAN